MQLEICNKCTCIKYIHIYYILTIIIIHYQHDSRHCKLTKTAQILQQKNHNPYKVSKESDRRTSFNSFPLFSIYNSN